VISQHPVPAVRAVIRDSIGRILLLKRPAGDAGAGGWCLPGGKVDWGQTVEEALVREVLEETTLVCSGVRFLFYQDSPAMTPGGMHCINFYFACDVEGAVVLSEESAAFAWVAPTEVASYRIVFRNDEGLARYLALVPGSAA